VLARASKAIGEHKQMHNEYVYSKLNEAVAKNNDLFNEVKDQQAIISLPLSNLGQSMTA